jgi:hypothetical protein
LTNITGKTYALTAVTPMKPWKTIFLRIFIWCLSHFKALNNDLIQLSFIHFARWVIITKDQFPYLGGSQEREQLEYDYVLFFSNFNGTWNQYIDAFSSVLAIGLNLFWHWSDKYPGAVPITPFKNYIQRVQFETDHYYSAYPHAATNDVKAAHRVQAAVDAFAQESSGLTAEQFSKAYLQFVLRVQCDLGSTGVAPVGV